MFHVVVVVEKRVALVFERTWYLMGFIGVLSVLRLDAGFFRWTITDRCGQYASGMDRFEEVR